MTNAIDEYSVDVIGLSLCEAVKVLEVVLLVQRVGLEDQRDCFVPRPPWTRCDPWWVEVFRGGRSLERR